MNRLIDSIRYEVETWVSQTDARDLRESTLTFVFAAILGAMVLFAFVPSVKEAILPVFESLLGSL